MSKYYFWLGAEADKAQQEIDRLARLNRKPGSNAMAQGVAHLFAVFSTALPLLDHTVERIKEDKEPTKRKCRPF